MVIRFPEHQIQDAATRLHQLAPAYLSDLITPYTPARSLQSANLTLVATNRYRLGGCGRRRFSVAGVLWNQLPARVKTANSIATLKTSLKTCLFVKHLHHCRSGKSSQHWDCLLMYIRPSFFNYLVYGSADPIFQDFKKKKNCLLFSTKKKNDFFIFFFTNFYFHVPSPEPG